MTSSASGIPVSAELKNAFESGKRLNNVAFIKIQIVNSQLEAVHTERKGSGGWHSDYDQIQHHLDDTEPCFVIFFKGRQELMLLLYVPEDASVKAKMSYSASKGALNTLVNAKQYDGSMQSAIGQSKEVEQVFGTKKSDFSRSSYQSNSSVKGPMSEVEEALAALPKQLDKKDFGKSMGYSLLATVSGKSLPPQLKNYAGGVSDKSNAASVSTSLFRGGGLFNIHAKPSEAKQANANKSGFNANRPPAGQGVLPGFGSAAKANANNSTSSSSNGTASHGRRLSVSTGKCLVASCNDKRVKNGYCLKCHAESEARREALFGGTEAQ